MKKSERLTKVIGYYAHGSKSEFGRMLGITPQAVTSWISRGKFDAELIVTKCVNLNARWLITGEGDMLEHRRTKATQSVPSSENFSETSSAPIPSELTRVMNEFLAISHTLTAQIAEGQRILAKSQQLFEQIVTAQNSAPHPYTSQVFMANEPNEQYKTK